MSDGGSANEASASGGARPAIPGGRGLIGRRPSAPITPGRLPSIRSRDLTLGGVKKKERHLVRGFNFNSKLTGERAQTNTKNLAGNLKPEEDVRMFGRRGLSWITTVHPILHATAQREIDKADLELEQIKVKFEPKRLELVREIASLEKQIEHCEKELAIQKRKYDRTLDLAEKSWQGEPELVDKSLQSAPELAWHEDIEVASNMCTNEIELARIPLDLAKNLWRGELEVVGKPKQGDIEQIIKPWARDIELINEHWQRALKVVSKPLQVEGESINSEAELANQPWLRELELVYNPSDSDFELVYMPYQERTHLVEPPAFAEKTFTPNIISRKIKEEPKEDLSIKKEKKDRDRDRQRDGAGRGRGRPDIIQSHSIFEQGPAEMMKKKGNWDSSVDMSDLGPSHIINIKKEKRETEEETKKILRMLEKDDFLDDPGLRNDTKNTPVQLPLAISGWLFKEENDDQDCKPWLSDSKEPKMEVDLPLKVKEEPMESEDVKNGTLDLKPALAKKVPGLPPDISLPELLESLNLTKEEELFFFQLPDTLPGQPPTQDTKPIKTEMQTEDGQTVLVKQEKSQEAKLAENTCSLADLAEGQVGKLLIRKSGKVQLVLGKVTLDVTMGTSSSFLQGYSFAASVSIIAPNRSVDFINIVSWELVSIDHGDGRTGDMTVLGHVKHKLVCSPDFESLLEYKQR